MKNKKIKSRWFRRFEKYLIKLQEILEKKNWRFSIFFKHPVHSLYKILCNISYRSELFEFGKWKDWIENHWFREFKKNEKRSRCLWESKKKWESNWGKDRFSGIKQIRGIRRKCIFRELEERGEVCYAVVLLGHMGILSSSRFQKIKISGEKFLKKIMVVSNAMDKIRIICTTQCSLSHFDQLVQIINILDSNARRIIMLETIILFLLNDINH